MMTFTEELAARLAGELLRIGAVSLSPGKPFEWASGLRAPVYCDNRLLLGHPDLRSLVADGFVALVTEKGIDAGVVGGIATAGIPHAALVADRLGAPLIYIRGAAKEHGRKRQIEGEVAAGSRVLLVEDLVSTGGSSLAAAAPLREAGCIVSAVVAVFTYGFEASRRAFEEAGIPLYTLTDFPMLIDVAADRALVFGGELESLREWYRDPAAWSASHP